MDTLLWKATDFSELYPELGLINNYALVIGPRHLTRDADLKNEVFLHSYDPHSDSDGAILEMILTGPLVVAHWINMQYLTSSIAPADFGSGDKTLHNVISNVGVMEGTISDLKIGLPEQSISFGGKPIHKPRRLIVMVYCEQIIVDAIIQQHQVLQHLVDGQWIFIKTISPQH